MVPPQSQLAVSLATTLVLTVLLATGAAFTRVIRDRDRVAALAREKAAAASASQRQLAINEFERGRNLCETGDLTQGLLWLASGLENSLPKWPIWTGRSALISGAGCLTFIGCGL